MMNCLDLAGLGKLSLQELLRRLFRRKKTLLLKFRFVPMEEDWLLRAVTFITTVNVKFYFSVRPSRWHAMSAL